MRWSWHEKKGTRHGPIERYSDKLKASEQETEERAQHEREYRYTSEGPPSPIYREFRICDRCGYEGHQIDMRWTGRRWLCDRCNKRYNRRS